jgi:hypothetical protein
LHQASPAHAGIAACTEDLDFPALAARIDAAISVITDLTGLVVRVTKPNPRPGP